MIQMLSHTSVCHYKNVKKQQQRDDELRTNQNELFWSHVSLDLSDCNEVRGHLKDFMKDVLKLGVPPDPLEPLILI